MEVFEDRLISVRECVVCLIDNDCLIVVFGKFFQAGFTLQGLYRSDCHPEERSKTALLCFFNRTAEAGGLENFVCSLLQQFASVREDQHSGSGGHLRRRDGGESDSLAQTGCHNDQGFCVSGCPFSLNSFDSFFLIGS